jgi:uncharacterized protein DUF6894
MPRYYFHLTDGKEILSNQKSLDLPGDAAAREDAMVLARDLKRGRVMADRDWAGWLVTVVDEHGHEIESVAIADVPTEEG